MDPVEVKHRFWQEGWGVYGPVMEEQEKTVIEAHPISCVVYMAGKEISQGDFSHLQHLLEIAHACQVKQFVFVLPSFFQGEMGKEGKDFDSRFDLAEKFFISYCKAYEITGLLLKTSILYGPYMYPIKDSLAYKILEGNESLWQVTLRQKGALYTEDLAFAIYQAVQREESGVFSISSLDEDRQETWGWRPHYQNGAAIEETKKWLCTYEETEKRKKVEEEESHRREVLKQKLIPYIENGIGFVLMAAIAWWQNGTPVNELTRVDFNYVYMGTMGLLYGKKQALLAFLFSSLILCGSLFSHQAELVSLLYMPQYLLHLTTYLFVAVLTGYFADAKTFTISSFTWKISQLKEQYDFLKTMFKESVAVKDALYRQIINSEDTVGRMYRLMRRLDRVELEDIFTQAGVVTEEILGVHDVAIYAVSGNKKFMRLKMHVGNTDLGGISKEISQHFYLRQVMESHQLFANTSLLQDAPDLAAPILYKGDVIALIEVRELDLSQWSTAEQNILSVTARLISDAIARALRYEADMEEKRYIEGTRILTESEFHHILKAMEERSRIQGKIPLGKITLLSQSMSLLALDRKLQNVIRPDDYVGMEQGNIQILLVGADTKAVELVIKRLEEAGIKVQ